MLLPCLVLAYAWLLSRRKKLLLSYPALGMVKQALGSHNAWRRHVPAVLLLALAASVLAVARPTASQVIRQCQAVSSSSSMVNPFR